MAVGEDANQIPVLKYLRPIPKPAFLRVKMTRFLTVLKDSFNKSTTLPIRDLIDVVQVSMHHGIQICSCNKELADSWSA
jgi:hypothetical protein